MPALHVRFPLLVLLALSLFGCSVGNPPLPSAGADGGTTPTVLQGAHFVHARKCAQCHQSDNADDGVLSGQTTPRAGTRAYGKNLTPDEATGLGAWSDEALLLAIRSGIDDRGAHLCAPMPQFMTMGDGEGAAIIAYLRSLAPVSRVIPPSECSADFGSAGDDSGITPRDAGAEAGPPIWDGGGDVLVVGEVDGGEDGGPCTMLAPSVPAGCTGCTAAHCQSNGCYSGSWCEPSTKRCHRKPANCG